MSNDPDLDPRWNWIYVHAYGDPGPVWIRGACNHLEPSETGRHCLTCGMDLPCPHREIIDVADVSGELVARLCTVCHEHWTIPLEVG